MGEPATVFVMTLDYCGDTYTVDWAARQAVFEELQVAFDDKEPREYTVRFHWMIDADYLALPEFEGF